MSTQNAVVVQPQQPGTVARREFGADQLAVAGETTTAMLTAQAEAMVKARFVVAMQRPRDWDDVRAKLLRACERPGFAGSATEKVWGAAWYRKPVGEGVEGFSIRFAEEALRCMGNIDVETTPIFEDATRRVLRVTVLDLEANISIPTSVSIEKTVIRKYLKKGEEALRVIVNSKNETTYLMLASEDEVFQKQQSLASKAIRNGILRLLPGDIQAECRTRMLAIRNGEAAKDPDGFRRKVVDGFGKLNILPSQLKDYLGHDLAQASPAELTDLRELWQAIEEGRTTWAEVMAAADAEEAPAPEKKPGLAGLTEKLKETGKACAHPDVPPSAVAALKANEGITCKACGEVLTNREPQPELGKAPADTPAAKERGQRKLVE